MKDKEKILEETKWGKKITLPIENQEYELHQTSLQELSEQEESGIEHLKC